MMPKVRAYKRPKVHREEGSRENPFDITGSDTESEPTVQPSVFTNNESTPQQSAPASNPVLHQDAIQPANSALGLQHSADSRQAPKAKLNDATEPARAHQESESNIRSDDFDRVMNILDRHDSESHIQMLKNNVLIIQRRFEDTQRLLETFQLQFADLSFEVQRTRGHANDVVSLGADLDVRSEREIKTKGDAFLANTEYQRLRSRRIEAGVSVLAQVEEVMLKQAAQLDYARALFDALGRSLPCLESIVDFWKRLWKIYNDINQAGSSTQPTRVKARWREVLRSSLWRDLMHVEMDLQIMEREAAEAEAAMARTVLTPGEEGTLSSVLATIAEERGLPFVSLCLLWGGNE